jgi:hypothetical protein
MTREKAMTQYEGKQARKEEVLDALVKPMSREEISAKTGIPGACIRTYVRELRGARKIYIADWRLDRKKWLELFLAGDKEDVPRPDIGKDDEDVPFKREPVVVKIRRDALVAAFFGEPSAQAA